jgi:hypothetical protein
MAIVDRLLTSEQQVLWKLYDQEGGLGFMTEEQLEQWAAACRTLMDDAGPNAMPARLLWRERMLEAELALADR